MITCILSFFNLSVSRPNFLVRFGPTLNSLLVYLQAKAERSMEHKHCYTLFFSEGTSCFLSPYSAKRVLDVE